MSFANKYYSVLGLNENASLAQIKKAYRTLSKKYHPDVCKEENARERFIEINEAYEFLSKKPMAPSRRRKRSPAFYARKEKIYKEWVEKNRTNVKARAEKAAEMNYNDWKKMNLGTAANLDCVAMVIFLGLVSILVPYLIDLMDGSKNERLLSTILGILLFISVPALAYFLTWKDYKIRDILKKRSQKK